MTVYLVTCLKTGMKYVGVTVRALSVRWARHRWDANAFAKGVTRKVCCRLARAIAKYGADNFTVEILQTCSTREEMFQAERDWIAKLKTLSPGGYNLSEGGHGGRVWTPEQIEAHRQKMLGNTRGWKKGQKNTSPARFVAGHEVKNKPVVATNQRTGEVHRFRSRKAYAAFLGIPYLKLTSMISGCIPFQNYGHDTDIPFKPYVPRTQSA